MKRLIVCLALVLGVASRADATTFYVSATGNNARSGTSPADAWQTIAAVNGHRFDPGDRILFEGGKTFSGSLYFDADDAGTAADPIEVSSYGSGRATIYATSGNAILGYNTAGFHISELYVIGAGRDGSTHSGIFFYNDLPGDVLLDTIVIDHVDAARFHDYGIEIGGETGKSGFRNVRITYVVASENGLGGIFTYAAQRATHRNVYVGHSSAFQNLGFAGLVYNSGNGITLSGVDGGTIEYSVAHDNGSRSDADNGPVGIWTFLSNNVVIQYCESYANKTGGTKDGGGFHLDNSTSNSVLQYNYSHDNTGAGYMLAHKDNDYVHSGNVIRWNVSQNDARRNNYAAIHLWGRIRNAQIYNNTVYLGSGNSVARAMHARNNTIETQDIENVRISNNSFQTTGGLALVDFTSAVLDTATGVRLEGNNYWSTGGSFRIVWKGTTYSSLAAFRSATGQERLNSADVGLSADPAMFAAGKGPSFNNASMILGLWQYRLTATSPLIDAGIDLSAFSIAIGSHDFFGAPSRSHGGWDIGANEFDLECGWSLSPGSATLDGAGGSGTVEVWAASTTCGWAAKRSATWLFASPEFGRGQGAVTVTASANTSGATRSATIAIGNQTFRVSQPSSGSGGGSGGGSGEGVVAGSWVQGDIGSPGAAGSASGNGTSFTIAGAGADIWGTADAFHYVSQPVSGDFDIDVRVSSVENVNAWTKAGPMIRETLDPGSKHAAIYVTPGKGLSFQYRSATDGTTASAASVAGTAPKTVRLSRRGTALTAYVQKSDGSWQTVGSATISMSATVYVGLAVSSHDPSRAATAQFDGAAVTPASGGGSGGGGSAQTPLTGTWAHSDVGATGQTGTASGDGTAFTVSGAGADIWGNADAFHYVDQPVTGDFDIDVRVSSVENVAAWTKAGPMVRETLAAGSKHVSVYVTPGKGISFQYRASTNGTSASAASLAGTAPQIVRLSRRGTTFTSYVQRADGSWQAVGSASITMPATVYVGLAVSSHDPSRLAAAQFDGVLITPR